VLSYFKRLMNLLRLAKLEAQLAGKTFWQLLLLCFIFSGLLLSAWLSILGLLFVFLLSFHLSWLLIFSLIVLLNFFLLLVIGLFIMYLKKNMLFPATRRQWNKDNAKKERRGNKNE
jgi:hypothetical protein